MSRLLCSLRSSTWLAPGAVRAQLSRGLGLLRSMVDAPMSRAVMCCFHRIVGIVTLAEAAFLVEHGCLRAGMHCVGPVWSEADFMAGMLPGFSLGLAEG